jgi:hypothetical protein
VFAAHRVDGIGVAPGQEDVEFKPPPRSKSARRDTDLSSAIVLDTNVVSAVRRRDGAEKRVLDGLKAPLAASSSCPS